MSTFVVFGVAKKHCVERAKRSVKKDFKESLSSWELKVAEAADKYFKTTSTLKPVSEKFDAPQFAREFIQLAHKSGVIRDCVIRCRRESGVNKKTGKKTYKWLNYSE